MHALSSLNLRRLTATALAAVALSLTTACDDYDDDIVEPPRAAEVEIVAGNPQTVARNAASQPLVVRVNDERDDPMSGVTVTFAVTTGTGTLSSATAVTGSNGQAQVVFTAGATTGAVTVTATVAGVTLPATFSITVN
jgi:Big-like domain-containing protein